MITSRNRRGSPSSQLCCGFGCTHTEKTCSPGRRWSLLGSTNSSFLLGPRRLITLEKRHYVRNNGNFGEPVFRARNFGANFGADFGMCQLVIPPTSTSMKNLFEPCFEDDQSTQVSSHHLLLSRSKLSCSSVPIPEQGAQNFRRRRL